MRRDTDRDTHLAGGQGEGFGQAAQFFAALGAVLLLIALFALPAAAAQPRGTVALDSDVITLGDVFTGLPPHADAARYLAPAPAPGGKTTLGAPSLARIARTLGLDWRPHTGSERVVLTRPATIVEGAEIEAALAAALEGRGAAQPFGLEFTSAAPRLVLPAGTAPDFAVTQLDYRAASGWFEATVTAPDGTAQHVTGKVVPRTRVPVLAAAVQAGTVIGPRDLTTVTVSTRTVQGDALLDPRAIAGMAARRTLPAGQVLRAIDVAPPRLVRRGDAVTMLYVDGGLELTAMGRALENGARGDVIRVTNSASSRSVDARVSGERHVTVEGI